MNQQVINLILDFSLVIEVIFLFTCGQMYMKLNILKKRRSYRLEKTAYMMIACAAVWDAVWNPDPAAAGMVIKTCFAVLLFLKAVSANRHYRQLLNVQKQMK